MSAVGPLENHGTEFASRNQFLFALLGMVSAKRKLDALVARHQRTNGAAQIDTPQPFLLMILGAVRLGESIRGHVATWATEAPETQPDPPERKPWLRGMLL
jgi:hypothetical protein